MITILTQVMLEDAGDLVLHILQLGEPDRAAGYELGGPVDVVAKAERDLAQDGAGGDGCLERFSVALAVDDDIPIERGGVEVVGDEREGHSLGRSVTCRRRRPWPRLPRL